MYSVILCGGSGSRLWPLSRKNYPKQFLNLFSDHSLIQETYLRMKKIMPADHIFFITNYENYFNVVNQIKEIEKDNFDEKRVLMEPLSLNTAPAVALSIKHLEDKFNVGKDEPVLFLPSDHYIGNLDKYLEILKNAFENVSDKIGTIGITPDRPETGFGYIKKGGNKNKYFEVLEFVEKPDKATAERYVASGEYVWNAGKYMFTPSSFWREAQMHAPEIFALGQKKLEEFLEKFPTLPAISLDYAISEKSKNIITFEGDFGWSDIGSFENLIEIREQDKNTRTVEIDSKNIYALSASNKLVATVGVDDLIIVENTDSILIQKKGHGQDVKKVVDYLKEKKMPEVEHNIIVYRPWGKYEVLIDDPNHKVKRLTVYPKAKLSLQHHNQRAEHWIVVSGIAKVVNGEQEIELTKNKSTFIPVGNKHQLENPGEENLEVIEVQTGDYFGEDDIIRHKDIYKRV